MYVTILSLVNCTTSSSMTTYLEQEDSFLVETLCKILFQGETWTMENTKYIPYVLIYSPGLERHILPRYTHVDKYIL